MAPQYNDKGEVRAGGGVVVRSRAGEIEVLLVYRSVFDDWSLPKGKVGARESDEDAALREVAEEAGIRCDLGDEVGAMHYFDRHGRAKVARYWLMVPTAGQAAAQAEIDDVRWVPLAEAAAWATRSGDRELLTKIAEVVRQVGDRFAVGAKVRVDEEPEHL